MSLNSMVHHSYEVALEGGFKLPNDPEEVMNLAAEAAVTAWGEDASHLPYQLAGLYEPSFHRVTDLESLRIPVIHQLADEARNSKESGNNALGAISLITAAAGLYIPNIVITNARSIKSDAIGSAARSWLFELSKDLPSAHAMFAGRMCLRLSDPSIVIDREASSLELSEIGTLANQLLKEKGGDDHESYDVNTTDTEAYSLDSTTLPVAAIEPKKRKAMFWLDDELPDELPAQLLTINGRQALICELMEYNSNLKDIAEDVLLAGQREQAVRFATMAISKILSGGQTKSLNKSSTTMAINYVGNLGSSSTLLRSYFAHIGNIEQIPVYGIIGISRSKRNQARLLRIITTQNLAAYKLG